MSTQWNSNHANLNLGYENYRPYVERPVILACRTCDKIFNNYQYLIEKFEYNENDDKRKKNNFHNTSLSSFRERNITKNKMNINNKESKNEQN